MYCYKCGYELKDVTNFCGKCGSKNVYDDLIPNEKKLTSETTTTSKEINAKQINTSEIITKRTKPKGVIILGVLILLLSLGFGSYYISFSKFFSDNSNNSKKTSTENKVIPNDNKVNKDSSVKSDVASSANKTDIDDITSPNYYIFPESGSEKLLDSDVSILTKENLTLARNEIYARHGFVFKAERFKSYFTNKSWYKPDPNFKDNDGELNNVETYNVELISKYENQY